MSKSDSPRADPDDPDRRPAPIEVPLEKVLSPLQRFANSQSTTGIALLVAVLVALVMANTGYRELYLSLNHLPIGISFGQWNLKMSLQHWVNEGLMALFFFLLGLEIKREFLAGELRDIRRSLLVVFMAVGGMIVPAGVYLLLVQGTQDVATSGWGIPMATDTAFALGILGLIGTRAPAAATLLLSALAILDDLGAVLVISLFYSNDLNPSTLPSAGVVLTVLLFFNLAGLRHPLLYLLGGTVLWWFVLQSGVHTTSAGILVALMIPSRPYAGTAWFKRRMSRILSRFDDITDDDRNVLEDKQQHALAQKAREVASKTTTPLQRWEDSLDRPISLVVLPLFAFLNAGVVLFSEAGMPTPTPVMAGVALGLLVGKGLGISTFAWLGVRAGLCRLPEGMDFRHIAALGLLAGIGFTMSLFISSLAFGNEPQLLIQAKLGILGGSLLAGMLGAALFLANRPST